MSHPLRLPSFTPCNQCIDGGDDDGLNDKERGDNRQKWGEEDGRVALVCFALYSGVTGGSGSWVPR